MNKGYVLGVGSVILGTVIGFMVASQKKLKDNAPKPDNLKLAGVPDQLEKEDLEQLENAKMVSEGSQFGVKYYNEVKEDEASYK